MLSYQLCGDLNSWLMSAEFRPTLVIFQTDEIEDSSSRANKPQWLGL
jgi:hypothetical protein